ncbi:MAG: acetylglutamate kinase [Bacillota bacterium]|nr:acetylglutamate kinase [Bacillota bacterium]
MSASTGPTGAEGWGAGGGRDERWLVVKHGGSLGAGLGTLPADLARLAGGGLRVALVHGGGPELSRWSGRLGIEPRWRGGLRVTDAETLELAEMVLAGHVNRRLTAALAAAGLPAVGLAALDGGLLELEPSAPEEGLGYVARVRGVRPALLGALAGAGFLPVVAPVGQAGGQTYNVNADHVAAALAAALRATLVLLTDVPGVAAGGAWRTRLAPEEVRGLLASGEASGGMRPKLEACLEALAGGAPRVVIVDGRAPHALLRALGGGLDGVGTELAPVGAGEPGGSGLWEREGAEG